MPLYEKKKRSSNGHKQRHVFGPIRRPSLGDSHVRIRVPEFKSQGQSPSEHLANVLGGG